MYFVFLTPQAPSHILPAIQTSVVLQPSLEPLKALRCTSLEWLPAGLVRLVLDPPSEVTALQIPQQWVLLVSESPNEKAAGFLSGLQTAPPRSDPAA